MPFISGTLKFFKCQVMSFALFFTIIHKFTEEIQFITVATIVKNTGANLVYSIKAIPLALLLMLTGKAIKATKNGEQLLQFLQSKV